ncbi:MAG: hypothetical protein QOG06_780 [Gaiellaceae bacterium]|jgi:hypothetical protein|nr:hypothetical protein [Gaiellaceae bacterium]MDX6506136.1 hypothetical protein [Gaiellaceae bacterium]
MKRITTLFAVTALLLAVSVPTVLASGGPDTRIVLKAAKAFPAAKGSAKFRAKGGQRELEAEVEHVRRLAGKRVTFYVAGTKLGTVKVSALGAAHISRSTQLGQAVPAVSAGTNVTVRKAAGAKIVSGSF